MGGFVLEAIIRIPPDIFRLNYWRYTLNCLRDAQLFIVCPFDWRFAAISLSNDETIIKLHTHPSWVHPVTPFFPGHYRCTCQLSLNERLAFFFLKLPNAGPVLITEWLIAIVLFGGGLAFIGWSMLVQGWLATVGERSMLVIRPYLYRLN